MTHKLLLADDSVTIQRVVELTFSGEDVQVVTVGDGEQAIARIPLERPDIVLADIGMPKRSGYDVAAFVKGRPDLSHIPVLLLAGAFEPVDDARAQQVKCDGVLVKPFEPQQVVSRVRELVDGAKDRVPVHAGPAVKAHESRIPSPEPRILESSRIPITPKPAAPEPPLEDYFKGLDAALAGLSSKSDGPAPMPELNEFSTSEVPTIDKLLAAAPLHDVPLATSTPPGSVLDGGSHSHTGESAVRPSGGNLILDAFNALLAMEQGEPVPAARTAPPPVAPAASPVVTDQLVDEVTRRVVEQLAPNAAKDLVKQIVSEVAERLVREEIARIKAAVSTRR